MTPTDLTTTLDEALHHAADTLRFARTIQATLEVARTSTPSSLWRPSFTPHA